MVAYLLYMVKTPLSIYEQQLRDGQIQPDDQQRRAIEKLDNIFTVLSAPQKKIFFRKLRKKSFINGLYMWGSVGIGKTYLMDLFYDCINCPKMRMHFFTFMHDIHKQLQKKQGQKNPLVSIASDIAAKTRVICFDEFFVTNIADAMILGELFKLLFESGITLIATSNTAPDNLYKEGLQRERFIPAIEALKQHTDVLHLTTDQDYRRQQRKPAEVYFFPLDNDTETKMQAAFDYYNSGDEYDREPLMVNTHSLAVIRKNNDILWCDFRDLCEQDRSQDDYIYLTQKFHTILIDGIEPIASNDRKTILRFVHMIDIFYDEHVRVVISAQIAAQDIYPTKGPHEFEFQRTLSRLIEMQSKAYFEN
jgi:cell division protein ZapE